MREGIDAVLKNWSVTRAPYEQAVWGASRGREVLDGLPSFSSLFVAIVVTNTMNKRAHSASKDPWAHCAHKLIARWEEVEQAFRHVSLYKAARTGLWSLSWSVAKRKPHTKALVQQGRANNFYCAFLVASEMNGIVRAETPLKGFK